MRGKEEDMVLYDGEEKKEKKEREEKTRYARCVSEKNENKGR